MELLSARWGFLMRASAVSFSNSRAILFGIQLWLSCDAITYRTKYSPLNTFSHLCDSWHLSCCVFNTHWMCTFFFQIDPDRIRSIFRVQLQKEFFTFKNGEFFIALKHGGTTKKVRGNQNGRSNRRSTRFVLLDRTPRKRRFPSALGSPRMKDFEPKFFEGLQKR